ncbi:MgtC/SapB family protein [Geopsychrobacter electrodiphilus]|uniref:MgtC/SapB family protein n=1 Tax=Geopsychrobacter electrodiphilus TaxID=225196 RepID=UPI0003669087|nr:MgtC/SapB family protein [Geopsychrobacter electrodiphilus]
MHALFTLPVDFSIFPLSWAGLITTFICGGIIGLERQLSGKPAGIRTSTLICMGTYIFVAAGTPLVSAGGDPTRIIGQVVTGIGFLGAGVILTREGSVLGVTSAATIWVLAAIGVMVGQERLYVAIVLALLTVGILFGVNLLERIFSSLQPGVHHQLKNLWRSTYNSEQ